MSRDVAMRLNALLPKISVVTPSFNQGRFLEACMRSVLDQRYPELEYIVIDGGSTDGSLDIIRKYSNQLRFWRSAPDAGHMAALNEGFSKSSGEVMAWINSDDKYVPWAFQAIADVFTKFPQVQWLTTLFPLVMDEEDRVLSCKQTEGYNRAAFYRGRNLRRESGFYSFVIEQESTFWRRSLWEEAGGRVDEALKVGGDFELWARFFEHADLYALAVPLACFRFQGTSLSFEHADVYRQVCETVLRRYGLLEPSWAEAHLRRALRILPPRLRRVPGLGYPAKIIEHAGRNQSWTVRHRWFV
ncbi:MAG: glycosyltransferase family 2 protein [Anaerolineales bacterium]|jgi:glycosyltransferase involved in cell wall biosynthesis